VKLTVSDLRSLALAFNQDEYGDYIYMYPPRQAYRPLAASSAQLLDLVKVSLRKRPEVNLYVHVPFCEQICRFCNLYTTARGGRDIYELYVDRVLAEAGALIESDLVPGNVLWRTLYFGGGTPSALPLDLLAKLINGLRITLGIADVDETAIEVAPETATPDYLAGLRTIGFDRVSMGFQSTSPLEIRQIGRNYPASNQAKIARTAIDLGFRNLCLDLIFGLPGQDTKTWRESLRAVTAMRPHTICCYQWTSRPHTGFSRMGHTKPPGYELRELYKMAVIELSAAGYAQETHVRWVRDGGGYLQKQYHWGLETLLGLGAGARSYFWDLDLRNGYSVKHRKAPLNSYISSSGLGWQRLPEGYLMSADERRRKAFVLGIGNLDRQWFADMFGADVKTFFGYYIDVLAERNLVSISPSHIRLTSMGQSFRDVIVQGFALVGSVSRGQC
jgi:oxygen-independent coproporphyrinogen-3 oxidase